MKIETMLAKALEESAEFGHYARYMLEEEPTLGMPMLRELFAHNASASEYRARGERIRAGWKKTLSPCSKARRTCRLCKNEYGASAFTTRTGFTCKWCHECRGDK